MAIITRQYSLGTATVLIVPRDDNPQVALLHNHEHNNNHEIFVGASTVTTTTGIHIPATETLQVTIPAGDELYACADGANRVLHVLIRNF
jgi:hypothetical protein